MERYCWENSWHLIQIFTW